MDMTNLALRARALPVKAWAMCLLGAVVLTLSACGGDTQAGCQADTDCRGDRICVAGTCQDPNDPNNDTNNDDNNDVNNDENNEPNNDVNNDENNDVNNDDRCIVDTDCPGDTFCEPQSGQCEPGCRPGTCPDGETCDFVTRQCVDDGVCQEDNDCDADQFCDEGVCLDGCREGGCDEGEVCDLDSRECVEVPCDGDGDCEDNQYCDEGLCTAGCREGGCDEGQFCDTDTRECVDEPCEEDSQCGDDEFCDEGECLPGCREGGCPDGEVCDLDSRTCVEAPCEGDDQCDDNQYCDEGLCTAGCREGGCDEGQFCDLDTRECQDNPCEEDSQCPDDAFCDVGDGVCLSGCREGGCEAGEVCDLDTRQCVLDLDEGPSIVIEPGEIDFGEVPQNVSSFLDVVITNVGDEDLELDFVGLQQNPSTGFQVIAPSQDDPVIVPSTESITYRVRFEPVFLQQNQPTRYGNTLVVINNTPDSERVEVPITGVGVPGAEQCIRFNDRQVDFGFVPPGDIAIEQVELTNCGEEAIDVTEVAFGNDDVPFQLTIGGQFPRTLEPGESFNVGVTYLPEGFEAQQVSLVASTDGDLSAETIVVAEGADCPESDIRGRVLLEDNEDNNFVRGGLAPGIGQAVQLNGLQSEDPAGGDLIFDWTIDAPEGSQDLGVEPGLDSGELTFVPDVEGTYIVTLNVTSELTELPNCEPSTFRIVVSNVSIVITWDDNSDLDLHVIRSVDGEFSEAGTRNNVNPEDCYFANDNPDWGEEGNPNDDPTYLVDDTDGFGPETVLLPVPEEDRSYQIFVRRSQARTRDTEVTVTITVGDQDPVVFTGELNFFNAEFIPAVIEGSGTIVPVGEEP